MKVLSLFDGISCARVAIERAGIKVDIYYASEVDKYAIQIAQKNYPDTIQLGSVKDIDCTGEKLHYGMGRLAETNIDLIVGGSPCQDLSIAKKDRKGLDGERSGLFWEYVRILKQVKPKYFILENVNSMSKEAKDTITKELGVEPIMINAALVSAQNRKRLFWTNIPNVKLPDDRGIFLKDILEDNVDEKYNISLQMQNTFAKPSGKNRSFLPMKPREPSGKAVTLTARYYKMGRGDNYIKRIGQIGKGGQGDRIYSPEGKSIGLSSTSVSKDSMVMQDTIIRKLTPLECERLQSLPDFFTAKGINEKGEGVDISNSQRYKVLGNAFNMEVVAWILHFIPH